MFPACPVTSLSGQAGFKGGVIGWWSVIMTMAFLNVIVFMYSCPPFMRMNPGAVFLPLSAPVILSGACRVNDARVFVVLKRFY